MIKQGIDTALRVLVLALCGACAPRVQAPPRATASSWEEIEGLRTFTTVSREAASHLDEPLPVLIVIHWYGSTPEEMLADGYPELDIPARLVLPQGPEPEKTGFAWWHLPRPHTQEQRAQVIGARAEHIARFAAAVATRYRSPAPPVVTGISQGGDLSFALAARHPGAITAALPIAGGLPEPLWPEAHPAEPVPPVDAFHGAADETAPFDAARRVVEVFRERGYPAAMHAYPGLEHDFSAQERAELLACAAQRLRGDRSPCHAPQASGASY